MPSALAAAITTTRTIQGLSNERAQNLSICGLYTIPRGLIRLPGRSEGRTVQTVTAPMGADAERPPEMRHVIEKSCGSFCMPLPKESKRR